jgi:hypothetical protein
VGFSCPSGLGTKEVSIVRPGGRGRVGFSNSIRALTPAGPFTSTHSVTLPKGWERTKMARSM